MLLEAKRSEPGECIRRRADRPDPRQTTLVVRRLEQVTRQHRHAVEHPLTHGVGRRQVHLHRVLIELADGDRLVADDQEIPLRRPDFLVQVHPEREHHVVCVKGLTIGKADAAAQRQREAAAVGRDGPGARERRLRLLRFAIDVNQVRRRAGDDLLRRCVNGDNRVERSRLGALDHHQLSARMADIRARDQPLGGGRGLLPGMACAGREDDGQRERQCGKSSRHQSSTARPSPRLLRMSRQGGRPLVQGICEQVVEQKDCEQCRRRQEHPPVR